jgi:hypothetical protein
LTEKHAEDDKNSQDSNNCWQSEWQDVSQFAVVEPVQVQKWLNQNEPKEDGSCFFLHFFSLVN